MASEKELSKIAELRAARRTLSDQGLHSEAETVRKHIKKLNRPHFGETLYLDVEGRQPVTVISVADEVVTHVPSGTPIRSAHQGNLYDADGKHVYRVIE